MDYLLVEINEHKKTINNLSTKLLNTFDTNEEISINNQIKKETEILSSLLNEKQDNSMNEIPLFDDINEDYFNPMINQNNMMNNKILQQQQMETKKLLEEGRKKSIFVKFKNDFSEPVSVQWKGNEKFSKVIERYRNLSNDRNEDEDFIFNSRALNPSSTIEESGIKNGSHIVVINNDLMG